MFSHVRLFATLWTLCNPVEPTSLLGSWNSPGKNTGVGSHAFLQGIILIQRSNPGLLHCRHILYHLSHQESSVCVCVCVCVFVCACTYIYMCAYTYFRFLIISYKILNAITCARQYILVAYFICSNLYC